MQITNFNENTKIKSKFYEAISDEYYEYFLGEYKTLRGNSWLKETGCPFSNKELKVVESKLRSGKIFELPGAVGAKSIFYYDENSQKYLLFIHRPKFLCKMKIKYIN